MRRRLSTFLTAAVLAAAVLLPVVPAAASDLGVDAGQLVLASQGVTSDEGLDPMSPDDEANEFAPAQYEPNWTWRVGGKVLLTVFLLIALYLGLMYYLRVVRPANRSSES